MIAWTLKIWHDIDCLKVPNPEQKTQVWEMAIFGPEKTQAWEMACGCFIFQTQTQAWVCNMFSCETGFFIRTMKISTFWTMNFTD